MNSQDPYDVEKADSSTFFEPRIGRRPEPRPLGKWETILCLGALAIFILPATVLIALWIQR